jgi:hypothetical protein
MAIGLVFETHARTEDNEQGRAAVAARARTGAAQALVLGAAARRHCRGVQPLTRFRAARQRRLPSAGPPSRCSMTGGCASATTGTAMGCGSRFAAAAAPPGPAGPGGESGGGCRAAGRSSRTCRCGGAAGSGSVGRYHLVGAEHLIGGVPRKPSLRELRLAGGLGVPASRRRRGSAMRGRQRAALVSGRGCPASCTGGALLAMKERPARAQCWSRGRGECKAG